MRTFLGAICIALTLAGALPVMADDWTAVRLRGMVLELVDGEWRRLERGDVVPDDRVVRTVGGRLTLMRGEESIELGPNTQIRIFDQGARRPFTTIKQYFGTVAVEAEVRDVDHFAVETPYLVAVVKGTRFVVTSDETSSEVKVRRGAVSVLGTGSDTETLVIAGQAASADGDAPLRVTGRGDLPEVVDGRGKPVKNKDASDGSGNSNSGNGSGSGNSGNGNGVTVISGNGNGGNGNGNGN